MTCLCCSAPYQNGTCNSDSSTSSSVDLYWSKVGSATYYQISYNEPSDEVFNVSSTNLTVPELTAGYLYTFYLQSFGPGGASNRSNCSYPTCKFTV